MKITEKYREKYKVIKFFDADKVAIINKEIKNSRWEPGVITTGHNDRKVALKIKNNFQSDYDNSKFYMMVDSCSEFLKYTVPTSSSSVIISKTHVGGYYKPHIDWHGLGHYSTTIFLNDPKSYSGGELCILPDSHGDEIKFKLEPGWGVTYETGIPHRVNTVTHGERLASVFWTESKIKNMDDLDKYRYYEKMYSWAKEFYEQTLVFENCHSFVRDPVVIFERKMRSILKNYEEMK